MSRIDPETFWEIDVFSRTRAVACSTVPKENKYHYVFQIPASAMRPTATTFRHFRTNPEGRAFEKCFHFFLDLMESMISAQQKSEPLPPGANTLVFLEWCPSTECKTQIQTAGWRFHVFVDRNMNEMFVMKRMMEGFKQKAAKLMARSKDVPSHYSIYTPVRYCMQVFSVYTGTCDNVEALHAGLVESSVSPSKAFVLKDMPGALGVDRYLNDSEEFSFPTPHFIRLDEGIFNAEFVTKRVLPCHMMFSCAKPEVMLHEDGGQYRVTFMPHRYYKEPEGFNGYWTEDQLQQFLDENDTQYLVFSEGSTREVGEVGEVTYAKQHHKGICWMDSNQLDDMKGDASQLYEAMRTNQADISTIDEITLRAIDKPDKHTFIEEEFKTKVWFDEDCFISDPLRKVIRWFHKEYNPSMMRTYPLVHENMSVIAHRACLVTHMYDKLYQVSSAHRPIYIIHLMRLDAFRHEMNMHLNSVFTGEGATSKSFVYELLKKNSIEGTVSERTYDTDKADAVDLDMNHMVHVFDEAPPSFFKDPKKRGPLEALKQRLTSMKTSHRRPFTDEKTGERTQITSISQNIGCLMGATNEPRSNFDKPLQTRFNWFEAEKLLSTTRTIADCQHAAETMGRVQRDKLKEAVHFHKFEQGYVALVWQFVRMGRIQSPDTTAVGIVMRIFKDELKKEGITIHSRNVERVKRLCQNLAIVRAKHILYHTVGGKYANVPFDIDQLKDAEPLMICTEEIVVHAVGLIFDSVVSRNRRKVLEKLWKMHEEGQVYRMNDRGLEDYNFIAMKGHLTNIATKVANALLEDSVHVSACNIVTIFREIKEQTISCKHYESNPPGDDGTIGDGFPEERGVHGRFSSIEHEGTNTYFHIHMFKHIRRNAAEKNIYKNIIDALLYEYTVPRKLLLGMNVMHSNEPAIWDTYNIKPRNREIVITEGIGAQEDYYGVIGDTIDKNEALRTDIDAHACYNRSEDVGYEVVPYETAEEDWGEIVPYPYRANKRKRIT